MKKRNRILDIAKGVAIIMVVITHYKFSSVERLQVFFPYWISMAVPIFMIVTGYISAASFEKAQVCSIREAYSPKPMLKKAVRYTLPFIYMYIVQMAIELFVRHTPPSQALWRFFVGGYGEHGTYYYPVLMQTIVVMPLLFTVLKKSRSAIYGIFAANLAIEVLKTAVGIDPQIWRLLMFRYIFALAAGCYIYLYGKQIKRWQSAIAFIIGVFYIWLVNYSSYEPKIFTLWTATSMITIFFIGPPLCAAIQRGAEIKFAPLELIGKASYFIFLAQVIYYNYLAPLVYKAVDVKAIEFLIGFVVSLGLGIGFYFAYNTLAKITRRRKHNKTPLCVG